MGLFVSTVVRTQAQAMQLGFFFLLPNILLSGFMFPREAMPAPAQWIGAALPLTYFLRVLRGILLKGVGIVEVWRATLSLVFLSPLFLGVSVRRFRKRIECTGGGGRSPSLGQCHRGTGRYANALPRAVSLVEAPWSPPHARRPRRRPVFTPPTAMPAAPRALGSGVAVAAPADRLALAARMALAVATSGRVAGVILSPDVSFIVTISVLMAFTT